MIEFEDHSNAKTKNNEETTQSFPLIEEIESVEEVMERTDELLQSAHHNGAVFIHRLTIANGGRLRRAGPSVQTTQLPLRKILSNAVRINRTERVFTANEVSRQRRPSHYTTRWRRPPSTPPGFSFFVNRLQRAGGATPICHSGQLWKALEKEYPGLC